jgi:hypothetical protein
VSDSVNWIHLAQDSVKWQALKALMRFSAP